MTHSLARSLVLAAVTGLILPLSFPRYDLGLLAWGALIPLHWALEGRTKVQAFWIGLLAGTIAFTGMMVWLVTTMNTYGQVPLIISCGIMLLLTFYLGLYFGLYAAGAVWLRTLAPRYGLFAMPCLWVSLELIRTSALSGMPWGLLGYSQYRHLELIQIVDHVGVYGVSFLIVLVNVALTELLSRLLPLRRGFRPGRLPWELVGVALLLMGLSWEYSLRILAGTSFTQISSTSITVGIVQPNIDQALKWNSANQKDIFARYARLTGQLGQALDLVIWPEAALPVIFEQDPTYQQELITLAKRTQTPILFGSPAIRFSPDRRVYLLNSAYLLSRDGHLLGRYDKQHLVPFGEYIPFKSSLLFFLNKLVEGIGDFEAGAGATILNIPVKSSSSVPIVAELSSRNLKFGVAICYEAIFPDLVRQFAVNGAEFLVTITNDAWFGQSAAPSQHFAMSVFRAVENHLALARAANTGISGFIDPFGRIEEATPLFTEQSIRATLRAWHSQTFYTRHGDVFAYSCAIVILLLYLFSYFRPKESEPDTIVVTPI